MSRLQLVPEDLDHTADANSAGNAERVAVWASNQDRRRSQSERFQHVRASLNATVNQERDSTLDPIHDLRQRINRRRRSIEISPTMIRHHDGLRAGLDRKLGILRVEDALEDEPAS